MSERGREGERERRDGNELKAQGFREVSEVEDENIIHFERGDEMIKPVTSYERLRLLLL